MIKPEGFAKEMRILVGTIVLAAIIYILNIEEADSDRSLDFVDSFLLILIPVILLRVFAITRNRGHTNNTTGIDSWPLQPGEATESHNTDPPSRVAEIKEMIHKSAVDPDFFDAIFAKQLQRAFGAENTTAPTLEYGQTLLRKISGTRGAVRQRNIERIKGYIAELKRGNDEPR